MASITSWAISGLRPRPGAIEPTASSPPASNLARHRRTVSGVVEHSRAIASLATPSAASSNAEDCTTTRCGNTDERAIASNSARCLRDTLNGAATTTGMLQP